MLRTFKYRIYPNKTQEKILEETLFLCCDLYNAALQERREAWKMRHISIKFYDQTYQIKDIRKDDPTGIGMLNFSACQKTLRRVDKVFKAFFNRVKDHNGKAGFPRFKPYRRFHSLEFVFGNGATRYG